MFSSQNFEREYASAVRELAVLKEIAELKFEDLINLE